MDINQQNNNIKDDNQLISLMDVLSSNTKNPKNIELNIPDYSLGHQEINPLNEEQESNSPLVETDLYNTNNFNGSYAIQIPKRVDEKSESISSDTTQDFSNSINKKQTLNESIPETILRDLYLVYNKLKYVINPFSKDINKSKYIKQWDLWGPLIFVTILSCTLAIHSNNKGNTITLTFGLFWFGSLLIYINAYLLNSKTKLFQMICLAGYCLFPLNISAFILAISNFYNIIRFILVVATCTWSLFSIFGFLKVTCSEEQKVLIYYPAVLLYAFLSWIIFVTNQYIKIDNNNSNAKSE